MLDSSPLLLAGAGHAHLFLLARRRQLPMREVILVEPGGFWYSGMASGVLGGRYAPAEDRLEPRRVMRNTAGDGGATLIRARLVGLDHARREALLDNGQRLKVSGLSLNLGSSTILPETITSKDNGINADMPTLWPVKPITALIGLRRRLSAELAAGRRPRLVVVGAGASGIEIACNLRALAEHCGGDARIQLVSRSAEPLPEAPTGARRWLRRHLEKRGIELLAGREFKRLTPGAALLAAAPSGASPQAAEQDIRLEQLDADHVVMASGLSAPEVIFRLGLPVLEGRGLAVEDTLQSPAADWVFAAGDCAAMINHRLPRLGVYGVRQAPVLLANLTAWHRGQPLSHYRPQSRALTILNLGAGMGLALRGRAWFAGRLAFVVKQWLDQRFLDGYR
ncbi:MAG TPA: FAD-dependent oxidoreductase [Halomonas sp.]|nr:FAD-dependent oxidoreductase [Halomonas sp.]